MAFDAFLKISNIPGESTDERHSDWINILCFSHAINQPTGTAPNSSAARIAQRAEHQAFVVVKALDKSSPKLAAACCSGERISEVILALCQAGGKKTQFMEYKMTDVTVSSVCPKGDVHGKDSLPLEEVAFRYLKIEWAYTVIDSATGMPQGDVKSYWDLVIDSGG